MVIHSLAGWWPQSDGKMGLRHLVSSHVSLLWPLPSPIPQLVPPPSAIKVSGPRSRLLCGDYSQQISMANSPGHSEMHEPKQQTLCLFAMVPAYLRLDAYSYSWLHHLWVFPHRCRIRCAVCCLCSGTALDPWRSWRRGHWTRSRGQKPWTF